MIYIVPIKQDEAKIFVKNIHRHLKPPVGSIFQIGCASDGKIVGVIMVGRYVSRHLDDGVCLEVNRLATDGTRNACSMLYATAWRMTKNLGYRRLITYILEHENGASLRASGWYEVGKCGRLSWNKKDRPGVDKSPKQFKILYEA